MKYTVAIVLVVVAMGSAEPPARGGVFARQQAYQPRGVRPAPRFQQQQVPPAPAASYGPPPQVYGPPAEPTTTETPITTTETAEVTTAEPQAESFIASPVSQKLQDSASPAGLYVIIPQTQNLVLAAGPVTSAKLQQLQQPRLLPVQAVPAFAKIQEVPQIVQYQAVVPVVSSAYTSIVNTPYSSTFVQSFQ